ncbi:MAG: haloacid dehalogenase-like hydrolase [Beijerinckiaceae bacterium]|nr:haloacid dehalogenase-like hydrolase [Beijerinckiaceae bacterium]
MKRILLALALVLTGALAAVAQQSDPLPSWNDGPSKRAIISFVDAVTTPGSKEFVPAAERIATFDNDGTLWVEQPVYTQAFFIVDRMKALAPSHPEWKSNPLFAAVVDKGLAGLGGATEHDLAALVGVTHGGMTPAEFRTIVSDWLASARDPRFGRPFSELVYQPMLEVLAYFRANGFKTYIVSGGGVEFVRAFAERVYGIPPEQVIGSRAKVSFETRDGRAVLMRQGGIEFIDDKAGKAIAIEQIIGRRPLAAFGNSDGDFEMLQWTTQAGGRRLGVIVRHTDAEREYAYDRLSSVGRLDRALEAAAGEGWTVVDMKSEWRSIFK